MRWGVGAGASRLVSGNMTIHRRLEERLADFKGTERCRAVRLGLPGERRRRSPRSPARATSSSPTRSTTRASSTAAGSRGPRRSSTTTATSSTSSGASQQAGGRGSLIVTDGVFSMDGDIAPLARDRRARAALRRARDGRRGARHRRARARAAAARWRPPGSRARSTSIVGTLGKALGAYGAYVCCDGTMARYLSNSARTLIFSTGAAAAGRGRRRSPRSSCCCEQPRRVEKLQRNARVLRERARRARAFDVDDGETQIVPLVIGDPHLAMAACEQALEQGVFAQAIRPPTRARRAARGCGWPRWPRTPSPSSAGPRAGAGLGSGRRRSSRRSGRAAPVDAGARAARRRGSTTAWPTPR